MIRKTALIYPCSRRYSGFLSTHKMPGMATSHSGLTILAQILEKKGITSRICDEEITPVTDRLLDEADLVGISIQTSWAPQGYRIAKKAKRFGKIVVMGGVHASLNPDEAILHADYVIRGEGEDAFPELIEALNTGGDLSAILGLSYWKDGEPVHNPVRPQMSTEELDKVPFPRFDMIEGFMDPWKHPINEYVYFTMLTRGCDQACTYCSITRVFGRALRHRSVNNVMEELGSRFNPNKQHLFFMDDSLANNPDYLKEVLYGILKNKLVPKHGWHSQLRVEVANDPELLRLMKETNCLFVTCGFESTNEKSLKSLAKGQSPADVKRAVRKLTDAGMIVNGFFMFGTDHDTVEDMPRTVQFAKETGCMLAGFMPLTPFPGTPLYKQFDRDGRIFTKDWELYDVQHVVYDPKQMSALDLYTKTLACYRQFYGPDFYTRHGLKAFKKSPFVVGIGAAWPLIKQYCYSRELTANFDYMRALRDREPSRSASFPNISGNFVAKDLLSGRTARNVVAKRPRPVKRVVKTARALATR